MVQVGQEPLALVDALLEGQLEELAAELVAGLAVAVPVEDSVRLAPPQRGPTAVVLPEPLQLLPPDHWSFQTA